VVKNDSLVVCFHLSLERVGKQEIEISHVISNNQFADIFTKPLGCTLFENLKDELGMVNIVY
jgi:hypothetical protein